MSRQRILVSGGSGFLGSHLCDRLLKEGHEVVCLDNFFTGSRANIEHLLDHHRFELVRHDITEPITMEVDEIYHLACPASPIHYQRNPVRTIRTAVQGTLNMLDLAREVRARILIASTSEVYGDPIEHPQRESYWGNVNPIGPRACYDEGKRCAEALAVSYARQYRSRCASPASSTPTGRACTRTTAGWCRTSSCRRCAASPSPSTARASRPVRSATSPT